jgi:hypothetical protein
MPLMDGDVLRLGVHELHVRNPAHPSGGPDAPPPGARQQLHDTLFGLPRRPPTPPGGTPVAPSPLPERSTAAGRGWIVVAAVVSLLLIVGLLLL